MNILYVHGFGSKYDPNHEKIQLLEQLGTVIGVDVDYCKGFQRVFDAVLNAVIDEKIDLIVGTSMGGYMAAHVGAKTGTPFVSLNPATTPSDNLVRWQGNFTDFTGNSHYLSNDVISNYPDIVTEGYGFIILDSADEIIDAHNTEALLEDVFQVHMFVGGSHRFAHMASAIPMIKTFYEQSESNYGTN